MCPAGCQSADNMTFCPITKLIRVIKYLKFISYLVYDRYNLTCVFDCKRSFFTKIILYINYKQSS